MYEQDRVKTNEEYKEVKKTHLSLEEDDAERGVEDDKGGMVYKMMIRRRNSR